MGVEPTYQPWEGRILPMNYTRKYYSKSIHSFFNFVKRYMTKKSAPIFIGAEYYYFFKEIANFAFAAIPSAFKPNRSSNPKAGPL